MQYIQNLPFILSSTIKRKMKMKKTLNLLFLLLAVFAISSCSSDDDEIKDSVKVITIYVSSETGESYGFNSTPEECMLVKFDNPNGEWREGNGRPDKEMIVCEWRHNHPDGKKADCIRDTGLSKPTVYKWWDSYDNYVTIDGKYLAEHGELDKFFSDLADEYWRKNDE